MKSIRLPHVLAAVVVVVIPAVGAGQNEVPVAAGDVLHIPVQTPHGYLVPEGGHVTYVLVRTLSYVP